MSEIIKSKKFQGVYYNILKDKTKSYFIRYTDPITKKKVKLTLGNSKRDGMNEIFCHNERARIISSLKFGENPNIPILKAKTQKLTLNDVAKQFFEHKSITGGYASLKDRQSRYNKHFGTDLGIKPLHSITKNDVLKLQKKLINSSYASATINSMIQQGSTIFNYALRNELYQGVNPFSNIGTLKVNNDRKRYLSKDDIKRLKKELINDPILYLFSTISLTTGARLKGVLNIKKKDINMIDKTLDIYDFKNKEFYVGFLTDEVYSLLVEHLEHLSNEDFVISYKNGLKVPRKTIQRKLKPILDELFNQNIQPGDRLNRVVIHSFRHTFASLLAIDSTPIFAIQKLMNHKDIKHTLRYAKLSPQSRKNEVIKVFNDV